MGDLQDYPKQNFKLYRIIVSAQFIKNLFMHVKNLYAKYSKDQNL